MALQSNQAVFSSRGDFLAYLSPDGCLKIWDTASNVLKQEYTPSSHLSSTCSVLTWYPSRSEYCSPKKKVKKRKHGAPTVTAISDLNLIAMGTISGSILLYSVAEGDLHTHLSNGHSNVINDICWHTETDSMFSCSSDQHIVRWSISQGRMDDKWKADKSSVYSLCVIDNNNLLSASSSIKWWNLETKTVIKKFTGHATEVFRLFPINMSKDNTVEGKYFVSAAASDRVINAWQLKEDKDCNSVACFTTSDEPVSLDISKRSDQPMIMAAVTKNGTLHVFEHQLNGKCKKPLLPKITIHIASNPDAGTKSQPIPILAAQISDCCQYLSVAYGSFLKPTFEKMPFEDCEKDSWLIRDISLPSTISLEVGVSNVKEPDRSGDVKVLAPGHMTQSNSSESVQKKRKRKGAKVNELPMEERLNALILDKPSENLFAQQSTAKSDSMVHLLVQGLQSKDSKLLNNVLQCREEALIRNTVKRLPVQCLLLLVNELSVRINRQTSNNSYPLWMEVVLDIHMPHLLEHKGELDPVNQLMYARNGMIQLLSETIGLLRVLLPKDNTSQEEECALNKDALIVYQEESSDEERMMDDLPSHSEEEEYWENSSQASSSLSEEDNSADSENEME